MDEIRKANLQRIANIESGFEKGRGLPIGTVRTHGGKRVIKTANGWKPHGDQKTITHDDVNPGDTITFKNPKTGAERTGTVKSKGIHTVDGRRQNAMVVRGDNGISYKITDSHILGTHNAKSKAKNVALDKLRRASHNVSAAGHRQKIAGIKKNIARLKKKGGSTDGSGYSIRIGELERRIKLHEKLAKEKS